MNLLTWKSIWLIFSWETRFSTESRSDSISQGDEFAYAGAIQNQNGGGVKMWTCPLLLLFAFFVFCSLVLSVLCFLFVSVSLRLFGALSLLCFSSQFEPTPISTFIISLSLGPTIIQEIGRVSLGLKSVSISCFFLMIKQTKKPQQNKAKGKQDQSVAERQSGSVGKSSFACFLKERCFYLWLYFDEACLCPLPLTLQKTLYQLSDTVTVDFLLALSRLSDAFSTRHALSLHRL